MSDPLTKLSQATRALAEAKTLNEIKAIRDMAEQVRLYAQANKLGLDAINAGTEIRLRADRKMGEVLIQAKETGEIKDGRPTKRSDDSTVSLSDIGLSKDHSSTAQQLAKLPEPVFEERVEQTKQAGQRLTTGKVLVQGDDRGAKEQKRLASKSVKANAKRQSVLSDAGTDGRGHDVDAGRSKAPFKTFFRYPGGKGKISAALVNEIVSLAKDGDEYREPFTGGGGVFVPVLASGKFRRMWINDYDYGIYCIWLSVKSFRKDIIDRVCKFTPSVEAFYEYKETLNRDCRHFHPSEVALMKIAIHQMSYSGLGTRAGGPIGGAGQTSQYDVSCRWSADNIVEQICAIHDAMNRVDMVITNMDYRALMTGDNAVMYLDPPYYEQGANLYHVTFTVQDHQELSNQLRCVKFPWLLSYDKCDDVRGLYAWASMRETEEIHYSIALKNGSAGKQSRFASEYLIAGGEL